jgi:hypothetical protein
MECPENVPDQVCSTLVELLASAAEAPPGWSELVTRQARLDGDLLLDEGELARLAVLLLDRFGPRADLAALRAGLGPDALEALTVGDLERELPPHTHPLAGEAR